MLYTSRDAWGMQSREFYYFLCYVGVSGYVIEGLEVVGPRDFPIGLSMYPLGILHACDCLDPAKTW